MRYKLVELEPFRHDEAKEQIDRTHGLHPDDRYLKPGRIPHIWCSGCGDGIVLKALIRAIAGLGIHRDEAVMVSGIGCSSRTPGYIDINTLHTTHGRALAFATGVKHANPDLHVIVVTGDGDATAIGGNHYIHAARRNIDITVLLYNNYIYGMTGGQVSPTTRPGDRASTAPYGNIEPAFNISGLARAAGASFVARGDVYNVKKLEKLIKLALQRKGFSLLEILSPCPTFSGTRTAQPARAQITPQSLLTSWTFGIPWPELMIKAGIGPAGVFGR